MCKLRCAGAVDYYGQKFGLPPARSLNASYLLWMPSNTNVKTVIYVDHTDAETQIFKLFGSAKKMGEVTNVYAREQGTEIYLMQNPVKGFAQIVQQKIDEKRNLFTKN